MGYKMFSKRKKKFSEFSKIYLFSLAVVFIIILFSSHFGLYHIKQKSVAVSDSIEADLWLSRAEYVSSKIKFDSDQHIQLRRQQEYIKLKSLIKKKFGANYSLLSTKFVDEKKSECFDILFMRGKTIADSTIFAFPWGLPDKQYFLYTALGFTESLEANNYPRDISVLIYDGSPQCSDVQISLTQFFKDSYPTKVVIYSKPKHNKHMWLHSGHGIYSSSLFWRQIIPIQYNQTPLESLASTLLPFIDHPGTNLPKEISAITIGYKHKNHLTADLLRTSLIAVDNLRLNKNPLENQGLWLSGLVAVKSAPLVLLVLTSIFLLFGLMVTSSLYYTEKKFNVFAGLIRSVYFSIPWIIFLILMKFFSINSSLSFTLTLTALSLSLLTLFFLKKMSLSLFNLKNDILSTIVITGIVLLPLAFSWPFFFFIILLMIVPYISMPRVPYSLSYSLIIIILFFIGWLITGGYDFSVLKNEFLAPMNLSKSLGSSAFYSLYDAFSIGSFLSLIMSNSEV